MRHMIFVFLDKYTSNGISLNINTTMSTENEQLDASEGGVSLADYGSTSASAAQPAERRESAPAQLDATNNNNDDDSSMDFNDDHDSNTHNTPDTAAAKSNAS